jgi:hypothetical protein
MGAEVTWYVKVLVPVEKIVRVSAVTMNEAAQEAMRTEGAISVVRVHDSDDLCHNCGTLLPDGCGGLFEKDGAACKRNAADRKGSP